MNCSIINNTTSTNLGGDHEGTEKVEFSASALQRPEVSRLALDTLIRRQKRTRENSSRLFWSQLLGRTSAANGNAAEA